MVNVFIVGEYEIECSAMNILAAYYSHVEVRVHRPNEPVGTVTYVYDGCRYATEEQALADARRQAEVIRRDRTITYEGMPV
jgi:hypothetical protein